MYKKRKLKIVVFILSAVLLTACTQQETNEEPPLSLGTEESSANAEREGNGSDMQLDAAVDISNRDILAASAGTTVVQVIENSMGGVISIDAQVDVGGISRVSCYRYIPLQFTEESRKALLKGRFPAEGWDVNKAALYDEERNVWEFETPLGKDWIYQVVVSEIPDEQIMNLERLDEKLDYTKESKVSSVRIAYELIEEDILLLMEAADCVPIEIEQIGKETIETIAGIDTYSCNCIHICEERGGRMYAKAVFKQVVDGMPVTVWHNFSTVTTRNEGIFPIREWGSLFSTEEIGLDKPILTLAEAVAAMQEQIDSVQMQETQMNITKISLEYLSVISSEGVSEIVPIWRFWPGNDEMERSMMCEQIFAVNAVSGELIWENREVFAEDFYGAS